MCHGAVVVQILRSLQSEPWKKTLLAASKTENKGIFQILWVILILFSSRQKNEVLDVMVGRGPLSGRGLGPGRTAYPIVFDQKKSQDNLGKRKQSRSPKSYSKSYYFSTLRRKPDQGGVMARSWHPAGTLAAAE